LQFAQEREDAQAAALSLGRGRSRVRKACVSSGVGDSGTPAVGLASRQRHRSDLEGASRMATTEVSLQLPRLGTLALALTATVALLLGHVLKAHPS